MYKKRKWLALVLVNIVLLVFIVFLTLTLIPVNSKINGLLKFFAWTMAGIIFCVLTMISTKVISFITEKINKKTLYSGESKLLSEFTEGLRYCYSLDDFYELIANVLEINADCSVLYINRDNNYVLYNSPNRSSSSTEVMSKLEMNFNKSWKDGFYFMGENLGVTSKIKKARGFFLVNSDFHLYVLCRYTRLFDPMLFPILYSEYVKFISRTKTISDMSEIASLSNEWQRLADTQKSFLPPEMPKIEHLKVAAYFRPLVNVSGDYYTVLPISPTKTLLMLGDVSGKGLAAALVMGLVMNTVKIIEDKDDLPTMIKAVDKAIKGMKLQDKYTVVFIGIVDTEKMTIRYVNASMSDPLIITQSPSGYKIKPLTSNCSLVGIIALDDITVTEQTLFRGDVILMASDGVSEVMNDEGVELGTTKLYQDTIKKSAAKDPKEFIDDVVNLVTTYNGGKKLRDDLTMMVAKVEG